MRTVAAALLVAMASCASLERPVYTQPVDPITGAPTGPAVPVMDPDGTTRTVGETLADGLDSAVGTAGHLLTLGTGNPILGTALGGLLASVGYVGSRKLRGRGGAPPKA